MKDLPLHQRLLVPVKTAAQAGGVSESTTWRAISDGHLEVRKVRGRTLVTVSSLFRWLDIEPPAAALPANDLNTPSETKPRQRRPRRRAPEHRPTA